jgi:RNA polymerase sigma-70 factor (ECF subfamily)
MLFPATTKPAPVHDERHDVELLRRVAACEQPALEELYFAYHGRLLRFLSRVGASRDLLDEAINETFWVVWQKAREFRGASRVSTWITGIAWRCTLKALRRSGAQPLQDCAAPDQSEPQVDETVALEARSEWLTRGLATLPLEQRATLELAYYIGHSCEEIALIMGCPVNTVKARMFQARIKLRNVLPALAGYDDSTPPSRGHVHAE